MNTDRIGIELGNLICEMNVESIEEIDDIIRPLDTMRMIFLEYFALQLWLTTQEASNVLSKEKFHRASNVAFTVVFDALNGIDELRDDPDFNMSKFQDFIHDRFDHYYAAWNDCPTGETDEKVRRNTAVVACFIHLCFADKAELDKIINEDNSSGICTNMLLVVGHHYCIFAERVRSVLSRYLPITF